VQPEREEAVQLMRFGAARVLVATGLGSTGLDFPDVQHVVNMQLPVFLHDYVARRV
jgi:superfamily II DNA/RNA helicase